MEGGISEILLPCLDRIYRITYKDQRDHVHENLIPVDMYPKIDEYFVNTKTKLINQSITFEPFITINLLDFSVDEMKHLCI